MSSCVLPRSENSSRSGITTWVCAPKKRKSRSPRKNSGTSQVLVASVSGGGSCGASAARASPNRQKALLRTPRVGTETRSSKTACRVTPHRSFGPVSMNWVFKMRALASFVYLLFSAGSPLFFAWWLAENSDQSKLSRCNPHTRFLRWSRPCGR